MFKLDGELNVCSLAVEGECLFCPERKKKERGEQGEQFFFGKIAETSPEVSDSSTHLPSNLRNCIYPPNLKESGADSVQSRKSPIKKLF